MSTPHPPCGLTKQEIQYWNEHGVPVVGGRYDDADGVEQLCNRTVGSHPAETAGGKNFSNLFVLHWACLTLFNNEDLSSQKLAAGIESIQLKIENRLKTVSFRLDGLEEKSQPTGRNKISGSKRGSCDYFSRDIWRRVCR
jgi:hypothetical protein